MSRWRLFKSLLTNSHLNWLSCLRAHAIKLVRRIFSVSWFSILLLFISLYFLLISKLTGLIISTNQVTSIHIFPICPSVDWSWRAPCKLLRGFAILTFFTLYSKLQLLKEDQHSSLHDLEALPYSLGGALIVGLPSVMAQRRPIAKDFTRGYTRSGMPRAIIQQWDCYSAAYLYYVAPVYVYPMGHTGAVAHKFDPPQQNRLYNYQPPTPYYKMNRTTTSRAPAFRMKTLREDDSHYLTLARAKVHGTVQFCDRIGVDHFKEDIFRIFNVGSRVRWRYLSDRNFSRQEQNNSEVADHWRLQPLIGPEKIREIFRNGRY